MSNIDRASPRSDKTVELPQLDAGQIGTGRRVFVPYIKPHNQVVVSSEAFKPLDRREGVDFSKFDKDSRLSPLSFDFSVFLSLSDAAFLGFVKFIDIDTWPDLPDNAPRLFGFAITNILKLPDFFNSIGCHSLELQWKQFVESFPFLDSDVFTLKDLLVLSGMSLNSKFGSYGNEGGESNGNSLDLSSKWELIFKERTDKNPVNSLVPVIKDKAVKVLDRSESLKNIIIEKLESFGLSHKEAKLTYKKLFKIYRLRNGEEEIFDALNFLEEQGLEKLFFEDFLKPNIDSVVSAFFVCGFSVQEIARLFKSGIFSIQTRIEPKKLIFRLMKVFLFQKDYVVNLINELDTIFNEGVCGIGYLPELLLNFEDEELFFIFTDKRGDELLKSIIVAIDEKRKGTFEPRVYDEIDRFIKPEYAPTAALDFDYNK